MSVEILDCTLRDGGHINNWDFGENVSKNIFTKLAKSQVDYIEVGYLKDCKYDNNRTLFNTIEDINKIAVEPYNAKILAMIVFGQFNFEKIVPKTDKIKLNGIRVIIKKHDIENMTDNLKKIRDCGYKLFINPSNIASYSEEELLNLIDKVNKIRPFCFTIVDTIGVLKENDIKNLYKIIDKNLRKEIYLDFHAHNNLKMAFSNAQTILNINNFRRLIIDSTVYGMGRGAGNLGTELLIPYINKNFSKNYRLEPVLNIIESEINPIYEKTPWGYSIPYYLSAINHAHPNYAKYMVEQKNLSYEQMETIFSQIPKENRSEFNKDIISLLCKSYLQ